ncbi:rhodanese-like domain-containing protein [Psychromonas antarctica]|uniref:rhodanese-like domain-containing protein n=1 Tax=Psychromonas antarctica TaxID=67573 RepID=UPI001EE7AAE4|nr:rhodanese-like domain-containing protein [Psychromonas antarctica]MCG6201057.1 rhodanese-like domain-containing protein [Psychromonas antarctica]
MKIKALFLVASLAIVALFSSFSFAAPVWIDVRTLMENKSDNIAGDVRISYVNIVEEVAKIYPDKNTEIYLYDNTGGRSDLAISDLKEAGYKNLHNAGSIEKARKQRGLTK